MARFLRALSLTVALGAALATLVAVSPAAADANGGAAPTASDATSGGATPGGPTGGPTQGTASSETTGGAKPGAKPPRRALPAKPRRVVKAKGKTRRSRGATGARRQVRRAPATAKAKRRPTAPTATPADPVAPGTVAGRFPVVGPYTFGGEGSRFGAGRPGHVHQGQDVSAASGTPVVAPVAGTVTWKANQPGGAGIYLVVRGAADGRDYVFMHLKRGSVVVAVGQTVAAGEALAQVGATGVASGPHLHFEIWVGGWQASGGEPIDPLPQLQRWAGGSR